MSDIELIKEKIIDSLNMKIYDLEKSKLVRLELNKYRVDGIPNYEYIMQNYKSSEIRNYISKENDKKILELINNLKIFYELGLLGEDIDQIKDLYKDINNILNDISNSCLNGENEDLNTLVEIKKNLEADKKVISNVSKIFDYIKSMDITEDEKLKYIYIITNFNALFYTRKNEKEEKQIKNKVEDKINQEEYNKVIDRAKYLYDNYFDMMKELMMVKESYSGVSLTLIPEDIKLKIQLYNIISSYELIAQTSSIKEEKELFNDLKSYVESYDKLYISININDTKEQENIEIIDDSIIDVDYLTFQDGKTFCDLGFDIQKLNKNKIERINTLIERLKSGAKIRENYYKVLGSDNLRYASIKDQDGVKLVVVYIPYNDFNNILIINAGEKSETIADAVKIEKKYGNLIKSQIEENIHSKKGGK